MRKMLWIMVSIFTASFAGGANAQKLDWQIFSEPFVTLFRSRSGPLRSESPGEGS